jgi:hypothetical protein
MSLIVLVLVLAGSTLLAFGSWGVFTAQGRSQYDEMAGIIPVGALAAGGLLLISAALFAILKRHRR